jgi:hypothetical protein
MEHLEGNVLKVDEERGKRDPSKGRQTLFILQYVQSQWI